MTKQIREQLEILCGCLSHEELDLEFVALHASHLAQLAIAARDELAAETLGLQTLPTFLGWARSGIARDCGSFDESKL